MLSQQNIAATTPTGARLVPGGATFNGFGCDDEAAARRDGPSPAHARPGLLQPLRPFCSPVRTTKLLNTALVPDADAFSLEASLGCEWSVSSRMRRLVSHLSYYQ